MATASEFANGRPWGHARRRFTPRPLGADPQLRPARIVARPDDDPLALAPQLLRVAGILRAALVRAARYLDLDIRVAEVLIAFGAVAWAQRPSELARRTGLSRSEIGRAHV